MWFGDSLWRSKMISSKKEDILGCEVDSLIPNSFLLVVEGHGQLLIGVRALASAKGHEATVCRCPQIDAMGELKEENV